MSPLQPNYPTFLFCAEELRCGGSVGIDNGGETMANVQNLMPVEELNSRRTPEQHSADSSKAGKRSGEVRRLRAAVKRVLETNLPNGMDELKKALEDAKIDTTNDNGIAFAMVLKALQGDTSAANWIRDTSGEKPKDEVSLGGEAVVIISGDDKIAD